MHDEMQAMIRRFRSGTTVTNRIKNIQQPRGGYIHPKMLQDSVRDDGKTLCEENIHPSIAGLAVDYLTRYIITKDPGDAFRIPLKGGHRANKEDEVRGYISKIKGLDDDSIENACRACLFDSYFRAGIPPSIEPSQMNVDRCTCGNIRIMVNRSQAFLEEYGPITESGPGFPGGYTDTVCSGDGDFLTVDTIWDFKVSKNPPTKNHTLQLAMYYIMGKHSRDRNFNTVTKIGIFNPRLNIVYTLDMGSVPRETMRAIETDVIGYKGSECLYRCR